MTDKSVAKTSDDIYRILETRRSVRYFEKRPVPLEILKKVVNAGRFAPSAMNRQPWQFVIVEDEKLVGKIFSNIALLKGSSPTKEQKAAAYIVILGDPSVSSWYKVDCSFATSNMLHAAMAEGLGTCVIGSANEKNIKNLLGIPSSVELCWLVAIGYPAEKPEAIEAEDGDLTRKTDKEGRFLVPKRKLDSILHINGY